MCFKTRRVRTRDFTVYIFFTETETFGLRSVIFHRSGSKVEDCHLTFWYVPNNDELKQMKIERRKKKKYPNLQDGILRNNRKLIHLKTTGLCCWRFHTMSNYRGNSEDICPGFEGLPRFLPQSVKTISCDSSSYC